MSLRNGTILDWQPLARSAGGLTEQLSRSSSLGTKNNQNKRNNPDNLSHAQSVLSCVKGLMRQMCVLEKLCERGEGFGLPRPSHSTTFEPSRPYLLLITLVLPNTFHLCYVMTFAWWLSLSLTISNNALNGNLVDTSSWSQIANSDGKLNCRVVQQHSRLWTRGIVLDIA